MPQIRSAYEIGRQPVLDSGRWTIIPLSPVRTTRSVISRFGSVRAAFNSTSKLDAKTALVDGLQIRTLPSAGGSGGLIPGGAGFCEVKWWTDVGSSDDWTAFKGGDHGLEVDRDRSLHLCSRAWAPYGGGGGGSPAWLSAPWDGCGRLRPAYGGGDAAPLDRGGDAH